MDVRRVTVYCGASAARDPAVEAEIRKFGREIAARGITLVYGGSSLGLMGSLADEVISAGGKVIGVIQVSRKGANPHSAGPDFTAEDLGNILALCKPLSKMLRHVAGE